MEQSLQHMSGFPQSHKTDQSSMITMGATIFVSYLMQKFQFSTMYYGMLYSLTSQAIVFILLLNYDWISIDNIYYYVYYISVIVVIVLIITMGIYLILNNIDSKNDHIIINISDPDIIQKFTDYVKKNKKYYQLSVNMNVGDIDKYHELGLCDDSSSSKKQSERIEAKTQIQDYDTQIKFDDKYLNIQGYYIWKKHTQESKVSDKATKQHTLKYASLYILKDRHIDPIDIIQKISNYIDDLSKNHLILNYCKMIGSKRHIVNFYDSTKETLEHLELKFMKPFFHQEKDRLWSVIKNSNINPSYYNDRGQTSRTSLLLYGPPGTGKSTLVYRIAMCLHRNIMSIDLNGLSKLEAYQLLQTPGLHFSGCTSYKDVIFLFEEFDILIKNLQLKEEKNKYSQDNYYFNMMEYYKCYKYKGEKDKNDNNTQTNGKKETSFTHERDNNDLTLRDLLEIFQGPIPFENMIMIANTNKFDEIKSICPELFRPGRMTPVYFGYIDSTTMQDISLYYFKKKLSIKLPDTMTISTSQIIELAFEALTQSNDQFEYFSNKLNILLG